MPGRTLENPKLGALFPAWLPRLTAFNTVGLIGAVVQLLLISAMTRLGGVAPWLATAVAVELTILHNFVWHERWTWLSVATGDPAGARGRLARFNLIGLLSLGTNVAITGILIALFSLPLEIANVAATVLCGLFAFKAADELIAGPQRALKPTEDVVPSPAATRPAGGRARRCQAPLTRAACSALAGVVLLATPGHAVAATLRPETEDAWRRYVLEAEQRIERQLAERAALPRAERGGLPLGVTPAGKNGKDATIEVPSGLIHHWRGRVFIPGVSVEEVVAQSKSGMAITRQPDVLTWRILENSGDTLRLFLKLEKSNVITVRYNSEHLVHYRQHGNGLASSRSVSTKIAELEDAGTASEREKPAGKDLGLLWRLNSYWRYEAVTGGVMVDCESISLSRSVPMGLGPFIGGVVDRIARDSMAQTLAALRESRDSGTGNRRNQGTRNQENQETRNQGTTNQRNQGN